MPWSRPMMALTLVVASACGSAHSRPTDEPATDAIDPSDRLLSEADGRPASGMQASPASDDVSTPRPPRTIFRSELARAIEPGPAYLLRQLGPEPFRHHGVFVGWELTALFPDDPSLCDLECDVAIGDVILSVNGSRLETPQQLSQALDELPERDQLVVHSLREGQRREVTYRIVDDR